MATTLAALGAQTRGGRKVGPAGRALGISVGVLGRFTCVWPRPPGCGPRLLCVGFSRLEYWGRLPTPLPAGDLPDPGIDMFNNKKQTPVRKKSHKTVRQAQASYRCCLQP